MLTALVGSQYLAATHVGGGLAGARWGLCVVIGLYLMIRPNEWKKVRPPPPPPLLSPSCFFPQPRRHFVALGPVRHEFAGANRPSAGANRTTSTRAASPTCRGRTRSTRRHSRSNTTCAPKALPFSPRWRLSVRLGFALGADHGGWRLAPAWGWFPPLSAEHGGCPSAWGFFCLGRTSCLGRPLPLGFFLVSPKTNLAVPSGGLQRV